MSGAVPLLPMGWLYRRLGRYYPVAFFLLQLSIGTLVTAGTVWLVTFFYAATSRELLEVLAITEGLTVGGLSYGFVKTLPRLRPLKRWIAGQREQRCSLEAWEAAVNLPARVFREDVPRALLVTGVPSVIAVVALLHLPWTTFWPLLAAGAAAATYAGVLQYFAIELGMRPVVDDIVKMLPRNFPFQRLGLPLRIKLLTILPLMSLLTGLIVAALTGGDSANLGVSFLITLGVVFSVSLELTFLLSDSITRPINALGDGIRAVEAGDFDVRVPVTTSDDLGELTDGFNRMAAGLAERERLREAFGTYLDKSAADYILSEGFSPEGVEVDASILFCDVRDFTGFSSDADASQVIAALNRLFEAVVPIVTRHGGHIDKFVGDGLLAVFGTPEGYADHADRALRAGCEIVEAVEEGKAGPLRVGVGINSGRVVAGAIGGAGRLNFSVIGDAVNVAARVEAATRDTSDALLVTAETRDALVRPVPLKSRGEVALRGKAQPVELFAVGPDQEEYDLATAATAGAS